MAQPALKPQIGGSFSLANAVFTPRLILALDGLEKCGKTNFALTAPDPIGFQDLDIGTEGVIQKFQSLKEIHHADYGFLVGKGDDQNAVMQKALPELDRFTKDYKDVVIPALKSGKLRTGVWDTGSEVWQMLRLARLGKLTQVMPHHYVALNLEYQNLIREMYETAGNFIILHKLKAEWKNDASGKGNKTGGYERAGYADTGFLVQVNATAWKDQEGEFHITVRDCRQNATINGLDLVGPQATFPWLGVNVFPDTDLAYWGDNS